MDFLTKILQEKKAEVAAMPLESIEEMPQRPSFKEYLQQHPDEMQVIGEVKRASPSKGDINLEVDILQQAKMYEEAGVAAISVLTDPVFFKGSIEDLRQIAQVVQVPLLCKDFIIDEKQLIRAKNSGASIVLLIVADLTEARLKELYTKALELNLEVLVETHNEEELNIAMQLPEAIIGVNNRNLKTFEVSLNTSEKLAKLLDDHLFVSESGFKEAADVTRVAPNYQAVLVGETLMRAEDPGKKVQELKVKR